MQPKPIPAPGAPRRNTLTKPHPTAPNAALYPTHATLPGAAPSYITGVPTASGMPAAGLPANMIAQQSNASQKPYLAAEMGMMQESLKISALKTAETIRYMTTVRRVGASRVKGPPPAIANELRAQLARYDQLCDLVEARLVRAHAALSARLARERAANPQLTRANTQNQPIQIESPMSDDVPLSLSAAIPTTTTKYTPASKTRGLASLAAPRPLTSAPDPTHTITPVTLASNAAVPSALDAMPSHHSVMPGLLEALRKQELEQARSALHRPPGQELDMFGGTGAATMEELFDPSGVELDIGSAVGVIDTSVNGLDASVSAMHSAVPVPDMDSAVAELDSAVAEMAAAGELAHANDPLFADLHAANGDGSALTSESFATVGLPSDGFPAPDDPFAPGDIPPGEFPVSGTNTGDGDKGDDLLAGLGGAGSNVDGMDLEMNMDLIEMGGLGIAAGEMGHTGDKDVIENINLGDVDIPGGDLMNNVGMEMDGDIEAMWSSIPFDGIFGGMEDGMTIKTEED